MSGTEPWYSVRLFQTSVSCIVPCLCSRQLLFQLSVWKPRHHAWHLSFSHTAHLVISKLGPLHHPQCCHLAQTTLISLDYYDNPSCCYSCSLLNHILTVILYKWTHGHGVPPWLSIWVHCCLYRDLRHSPSTCPLLNLLDFTDSLVHSRRPH